MVLSRDRSHIISTTIIRRAILKHSERTSSLQSSRIVCSVPVAVADLRLVRPMRLAVLLLLFFAVATAEATQPASEAYRKRADTLLTMAMSPALDRRLDHVQFLNIHFRCRIGEHGDVQSVTVLSSNQPRSFSGPLIAALKAAKLPPLPRTVLKEQGRNWIDVDTGMVLAE